MPSDSFAKIQSAIRAAIDGAPSACATLCVSGEPTRWLQIVDDTVNAAYSFEAEPGTVLGLLPAMEDLTVSEWEPRKFCTVCLEDIAAPGLPAWIDAYFVAILEAPAGAYHLDLKLEEL